VALGQKAFASGSQNWGETENSFLAGGRGVTGCPRRKNSGPRVERKRREGGRTFRRLNFLYRKEQGVGRRTVAGGRLDRKGGSSRQIEFGRMIPLHHTPHPVEWKSDGRGRAGDGEKNWNSSLAEPRIGVRQGIWKRKKKRMGCCSKK